MAALLTTFYPQILSVLPKCPKVLVREMILMAATELCEKALIWREIQTAYSIVSGTRDYTYTAPAGARVFKCMSAELDGVPVDWETPENLDLWFPGWRLPASTVQTGGTFALTQISTTAFMLVPKPSANGTLILDVAYSPLKTATSLPDFLYQDYYEAIAAGAKARLQIMNDKPWTELTQAAVNAKLFSDALIEASNRQQEGFGRPRIRTRAQFL